MLWSAEHHFFDYSFCPDNLQLMTYLAGVCPNIDLGTAAVILPWHDPLRVAEQAAVLDLLCKGRLRLGLGRGLARREFAAFRGTMNESRERFDEAAPMIVNALRTGVMEGNGKFYQQPRIEIRPKPKYSFDGRIYAVASSEDSVEAAARLGAHMVMFSDRPWPMRLPAIQRNRELLRKFHGREAPTDADRRLLRLLAEAGRGRGTGAQAHGQLRAQQFRALRIAGRSLQHGEGLRCLRAEGGDRQGGGMDGAIAGFMKAAVWGTPDRILRELEARRAVIGEFELDTAFRFGGIPYETAETSLRLFAKEVLPVLQSWKTEAMTSAAAE